MSLPADIPREALPHIVAAGYLDEDRLRVGDAVPRLTAYALGGEALRLDDVWTERPAVLIFGSYT